MSTVLAWNVLRNFIRIKYKAICDLRYSYSLHHCSHCGLPPKEWTTRYREVNVVYTTARVRTIIYKRRVAVLNGTQVKSKCFSWWSVKRLCSILSLWQNDLVFGDFLKVNLAFHKILCPPIFGKFSQYWQNFIFVDGVIKSIHRHL